MLRLSIVRCAYTSSNLSRGFFPHSFFLLTVVWSTIGARSVWSATSISGTAEFIQQHCVDCHGVVEKEAGLDLTSLIFKPDDRANFSLWVRLHDRVRAGEMPPKDQVRPQAKDIDRFANAISSELTDFEQSRSAQEGRSVQRRLNRYEYENVLRDLLGVPWLAIRDKLPQDGEAYHFNKVGDSLDISHVQMTRLMSAADYAIRQSMGAAYNRPEVSTRRLYARDEIRNYWPRENGTLPDRLSFPVLDSRAQPDVRAGRAPISNPETREREAVGKVSSTFSDAGGYGWSFRAPVGGRYRLRFKGYSVWVGGGGIGRWFYEGSGEEKAPVYWLPVWHRPELDEVWAGRTNEPMGVYATSSGQKRPVGAFDLTPEPTVSAMEVVLAPGEAIQTDGSRLFRTRVSGTDEQYVNPRAQEDGMPGYALQWFEVEGPLPEPSIEAGYRLLFGDLPMKPVEAGQPGVVIETAPRANTEGSGANGQGIDAQGRPVRTFRGGRRDVRLAQTIVDVETKNPRQDGERLLRAFMKRAYRSPVEEAQVGRMIELFHDQLDKGFGFAKSLISTYTAVLISPAFIFVQEKPGRLDDYALATRLSLFLWNSEPDANLRSLAETSKLREPDVLRAQADRLLDNPGAKRFVEAFTDYWLDLRKIDDTSPSSTLYNDYELDDTLKLSAVEETRLFVEELILKDLPARNIVDSDFTFLNERLAKHYGISGVEGSTIRRVHLPDDSARGGLMTQASILKITANGTTTSPVLRGHWITERILGLETPPPPPVPVIEPDIRGAVTIRQQLDLHRADSSCASCHSKMDPAGFALESFDVMGGWRDKYRAASDDVKPEAGVGMNGQRFVFHFAQPVDCGGQLPDGRSFANVRQLKKLLLVDEAAIARNLVQQLLVYATGAPVRFSDRAEIERILARTADRHYGVRSLVTEVVRSDLFQTK
jgi:hypothetical protein